MSINFPTTLDSFANPVGTDLLENANNALDHDRQHSDANDAIEALEAKVGINGSAVTSTHDYKLSSIPDGQKALSSGTSTQSITGLTLVNPIFTLGSDATGDMFYRNSGGAIARLPIGTSGQIIQTSSGGIPEWISNPAAADASTTVKGVVEEATQAEVDDGTAAGGTSARLAINPSTLRAKTYNSGVVDTGSSTAYAIAPSPAITAYAAYQEFTFKAVNANTTTTPTLNVNALGAKTMINPDGTPLVIGQIAANSIVKCVYDGTSMMVVSVTQIGSPFAVGTDTGAAYTTLQMGIYPTSSTAISGWTSSSVTNTSTNAGYVLLTPTASSNLELSTNLWGSGSTANYSPAQSKVIRIKTQLKFADTSDRKGFGLVVTPANVHTAQTDVTNGEVRFILNGSTMYAQNANGSTATTTDVSSGITFTNWNTYEIVFTPGTDIKFYINGVLKATHSTNLPSSGTLVLAYGVNANGRTIETTAPIVSIQN